MPSVRTRGSGYKLEHRQTSMEHWNTLDLHGGHGHGHPALDVPAWSGVGLGGARGPCADLQESFLLAAVMKKLDINEHCELYNCFLPLVILICLLPSVFPALLHQCNHDAKSLQLPYVIPRISFAL